MTDIDRDRRTARLAQAAAARTAAAESRARRAIMKLDHSNEPITFVAVARCGQVFMSFLYQHRQLRRQILERRRPHPSAQRPVAESALTGSLRVKLQVALRRNQELLEELVVLRGENEALRSRLLTLEHRGSASHAG